MIIDSIMTNNPCYKEGTKIIVKGLMLHSVGCSQPKASAFISNWNRDTFTSACVHAFIDGLDGNVYQTLPWEYRGWHSGGASNSTHIGVEMCEPDCIRYIGGSSFTCTNEDRARDIVKRTYDAAVELFAKLCKDYNLNPLGDGVIISHSEGYMRGVACNHGDPEHIWNQLKMGYTMDGFRRDVKSKMDNTSDPHPSIMYRVQVGAYRVKINADIQLMRVRKHFPNAYIKHINGYYKIQVGAYVVKSNAEVMLKRVKDKGFKAFITTEN